MEGTAKKIQAVINTLQKIMFPATYENMNNMMGVLQALAAVRDEVENMTKLNNELAEKAFRGNADAAEEQGGRDNGTD